MINLTPQGALDLPIDELALHVLSDPLNQDAHSEYNYTLSYRNERTSGNMWNTPALQAIAEALGRLRAHGMIARTPSDMRCPSMTWLRHRRRF